VYGLNPADGFTTFTSDVGVSELATGYAGNNHFSGV